MKRFIVATLILVVLSVEAGQLSDPKHKNYLVAAISEVKASCNDEVEPTLLLPGCYLSLKEKSNSVGGSLVKVYANPELCKLKAGDKIELAYRVADCDVSFELRRGEYKDNRVELKRKDEYFACVVRRRELVTVYKIKSVKKPVIRIYNEEKMAYEDFGG